MEHKTIMNSEVKAYCYAGDSHDQVEKYFATFCVGDKDGDTHIEDLTIRLKDLPPGAVVRVSYPCCPECGIERQENRVSNSDGTQEIVGFHSKCHCGFDWDEWVLGQYA